MGTPAKWRVAHLSPNDVTSHDQFVSQFQRAYQANGNPKNMAMFSHNDSFGTLMAVSITPESVPYCQFSGDWSEQDKSPFDFGNVGWVAGDESLK